jgi:energy-coupling factor transport system ATP-binding protein
LERDPFTLSGGEMVRAALAINAVTNPKLWLLDQIFDWLYPESAEYIKSLMHQEILIGNSVVETHSVKPKWYSKFDLTFDDIAKRNVPKPLTKIDTKPSSNLESKKLVLQTKTLQFQYSNNGFKLGPINLNIFSGDVVAFVGENGSGKTTLLQCIANLNRNIKGNIKVNGLSPPSKGWEWARSVIYCFQNPDDQLYKATVIEEIETTLKALKRPIPQNLHKILQNYGLKDYLDCEPYHLARPIRRMVCFAATMLSGSPVILLDEPTVNLDSALKKIVLNNILQAASQKTAIIMVSHDSNFIDHSANRILEMSNGVIKREIL